MCALSSLNFELSRMNVNTSLMGRNYQEVIIYLPFETNHCQFVFVYYYVSFKMKTVYQVSFILSLTIKSSDNNSFTNLNVVFVYYLFESFVADQV